MWFLLLLIAPCLAVPMQEPPPPTRSSRVDPVEGWVQVRLNHFMAYDTRTYPMRYYYNNEFAGNNIVIFVGGEWAISESWTQAGLAYELAELMRAGLFYTEHRFYGGSRPFVDSELENLSFLSIDQALADLVQFIQHVKSDAFEGGRYKDAKVALVGCSYAGTMATWMRLAYPHVVDAAFSDSGPLHAQEDFPEYLEVITEAIREQGGETCVDNIEQAMTELVEMLATPTGPAQVSEMFNTCTPIQAGTALDVATFFWYGITETFAYLVQTATPGNILVACGVLTDVNVASPVQRLANFVATSPWTRSCIETRYSQVVANHRNTSLDAYESANVMLIVERTDYAPDCRDTLLGRSDNLLADVLPVGVVEGDRGILTRDYDGEGPLRLWTYQTCVEFGWYQSTTSSRQPFLHTVPVEYFHQMCKDFFSTYFDEARLRAGIDRTNIFFGGPSHLPDNVVSVAGGHDPWSPMGPNETHAHHNAPVYVVPGVSHCRAIHPRGNSDTEELEAVKNAVIDHMYEFIFGPIDREPDADGANNMAASIALLLTALFVAL